MRPGAPAPFVTKSICLYFPTLTYISRLGTIEHFQIKSQTGHLMGKPDTPTEPAGGETFALFSDEDLSLQEYAFDEMNIVEMPIALLTRDTSGIYEIPLSADGESRLVCSNSSKYGLPNSLAPKVVLGLMWLWAKEYPQGAQTFTFKVRDLVRRYMYPDRFQNYPPNGELLRSVERQIHCLAGSQIHTNRWWDSGRKAHKEVDISIIDGVVTVDEGGRNRPRVLEVTWGKYFWQSLINRYTKPIDARLVQSLEKPLDLALYRLLDRQLSQKPRQRYTNIIHLARYKLGMQGQKIDAGGRTASSYIAKLLRQALLRLSREQFTVRMTIDRSKDVFSVTFEKLEHRTPQQPHEVREQDDAGELIREFDFCAHKVPRERKRTRIAKADREQAQEWVEAYGIEKAKWMVGHSVALQKQRGRESILLFRGLQMYEAAAAGAYEQAQQERAGQLRLAYVDQQSQLWERYQDALVQAFDAKHGQDEQERLKGTALEAVRERFAFMRQAPERVMQSAAEAELAGLKRERMNGMNEGEFRAYKTAEALRAALLQRHRFDPLSADGGSPA